jgi:hypothetical protein
LEALPPAARAELLHVLMLPELERVERMGEFWSYPQSRTFAELLIDLEEVNAARAVVFGLLAEMERKWSPYPSSMRSLIRGPWRRSPRRRRAR